MEQPRNAGPAVPPGVDPGHAAQASAKSKAARKNEKRKEKKQSSEPDIVSERESSGAAATGIEKGMGALQLAPRESSGAAQDESSSRPSRNVQPSSASADAGTDGSAFIELEKKIRALRKKIRQAESLEAASASRQRTPEEEDKIRRLELWRKELIELEAAQRI